MSDSSDSLYQTKEYQEPQIERISDSCYNYETVYEAGYRYCVKGAGDHYYSIYDAYGGDYTDSWSRLLYYFKKGTVTWGTLLDFSKVKGWWPFHDRMTFTYGRNTKSGIAEGEYFIKLSEKSDSTGKHYVPEIYNVANSDECRNKDRIGMFGTYIYTDYKGNYKFITNKGDTLTIPTLTPLNEERPFYRNDSLNLVIKAHCQSINEEMVINTVDFVQHFKFQAYDLNGNNVNHPVNNKEVALSKFHALYSINPKYMPLQPIYQPR